MFQLRLVQLSFQFLAQLLEIFPHFTLLDDSFLVHVAVLEKFEEVFVVVAQL